MDETLKIQIDAQVNALVQQRDANANQVVQLVGELACVKAELAALKTEKESVKDEN